MKMNEIKRMARLEPKVYVKVKFITISSVCGQPYPQSTQWGESTSEQTVEAMQENHQRRGRFYIITRPWSPMRGDPLLGLLPIAKLFELCNNSYELNFFDVVLPYIKL